MIPKNEFYFTSSYRYKNALHHNKLISQHAEVSKEIINGVISVDVRKREDDEVFMSFTTVRAKKLIRYILSITNAKKKVL
ncbi:hypothetical protein [Aquimarina sp. AD10]|uniref:hypothetical protein n=1 Tax=Aquimarina sp. AD10 TaxID=1714849 RepID=UPI0011C451F2|nr:hypothetical protein [Aquimarina sp. AD10]